MKNTVHEMICDSCSVKDRIEGDPYVIGWRRLTIKFEGEPYPQFEGDTCPACTEKHRAIFAGMRPGAEAIALLGSVAGKEIGK